MSASKSNIIEINNLTKIYRRKNREAGLKGAFKSLFVNSDISVTAIDNISFNIEQGDIVAYLGPNGAGKSTTIKLLTGILLPTSGTISVMDKQPYENRRYLSKNIGAIFGQRSQLLWDIPLEESFKLNKDIYQIPNDIYRQQIEFFDKVFDISELINISVRQLSLGQRIRAEICISMLHRPHILYMDEPTIGLDVVAKKNIMDSLSEINKNYGTTIFLTTHDMTYVEKVCNKALVMQKGKVIFNGGMSDLRKLYKGNILVALKFENNYSPVENPIPNNVGSLVNIIDKQTIEVECKDSKNIPLLLNILNQSNIVLNIEIKRESLDDIMIELHKNNE